MKKQPITTVWHQASITRQQREVMNQHRSVAIWFMGLSGSGKRTLAHALEQQLHQIGWRTLVLDGDNVRHGLCSNLGFSSADRSENVHRAAEVAKLMGEAGVIVITAFISPFRADRERVRSLFPGGDFIEVYCSAPLEVCESRDVKGLYARDRSGAVKKFSGISPPYEPSENPDLVVDTSVQPLESCVAEVMDFLQKRSRQIFIKKQIDL